MPGRSWIVLLGFVWVLVLGLLVQDSAAERPVRRRVMEPQRFNAARGYPEAKTDPVPLPGKKPYWGQALGATHYNWGFFGAQRHPQYISHAGYYGEYYQFGYAKGY